MLLNLSWISDGCGDYPGKIITDLESRIFLGDVALQDNETYAECRSRCIESYPEFDFYQNFKYSRKCECAKFKAGKVITLAASGEYTFGYANACGKSASGFHTLNILYFFIAINPTKIYS